MVTYSSDNKEVMQLAGLSTLRKKSTSEIAELVKSVKENKKKLNVESDEKHNLKQLREFTEIQRICFDTCKDNLKKKFETDLIEYTNVNQKNNLSFNEDSKKNLENYYKQLEEQLCYYTCSKKYNYLLSNRT